MAAVAASHLVARCRDVEDESLNRALSDCQKSGTEGHWRVSEAMGCGASTEGGGMTPGSPEMLKLQKTNVNHPVRLSMNEWV